VLVTGVVRADGRFAAVASRPLFRAARELGAFYRAALADELRSQGYAIDAGTGKDGRYFELDGVPASVRETLSGRSREVWLAAERFRARYGRAPERGELRNVKLENRRAKTQQTRADLDRAWRQTAAEHGLDRAQAKRLQLGGERGAVHRQDAQDFEQRVQAALTARGATFDESELRAAVLEQTVGADAPEQASIRVAALLDSGRVIALEEERMTTATVRDAERAIERRLAELARARGAAVDGRARERALAQVAERIGGPLSAEQRRAVELLGAEQRVALLVGEAGVGKGVVIDAAARAELLSGREAIGIAVAGATAERFGRDSPSLAGATLTLDALIARCDAHSMRLSERCTVFFDEAAMADTGRLDRLTELVAAREAKLVLIGDARQLPAIGAGGMFERIAEHAPVARLAEVYRTADVQERGAWSDLRAGRAERAMAHYQSRGQLHFTDTREQALEQAVRQWASLTEHLDPREVAMMSDASTTEIERLNARAQQLRAERGELGADELALPAVAYGLHSGDRVAFVAQHRPAGEGRVENGTRAEVITLAPEQQRVTLRTDGSQREVTVERDELAALRLGYAQHLYRQQGATVEHAVVVTGGWQTSREGAYVQASRARRGTDWHLAREDLGTQGADADRIERLAEAMRAERATPCSIEFQERELSMEVGHDLGRSTERLLERGHEHVRERDRGMGIDL
jgi:ATP-dependent exoDNAse (exonuclease V) alpha subunit